MNMHACIQKTHNLDLQQQRIARKTGEPLLFGLVSLPTGILRTSKFNMQPNAYHQRLQSCSPTVAALHKQWSVGGIQSYERARLIPLMGGISTGGAHFGLRLWMPEAQDPPPALYASLRAAAFPLKAPGPRCCWHLPGKLPGLSRTR